jgi:hypothetical protein
MPDHVRGHHAVLLPEQGLLFTAASIVAQPLPQADCLRAARGMPRWGDAPWDLPTIDQWQFIVDRRCHGPAVSAAFFPHLQREWYWSRTPAAWSGDSVWAVHLQ